MKELENLGTFTRYKKYELPCTVVVDEKSSLMAILSSDKWLITDFHEITCQLIEIGAIYCDKKGYPVIKHKGSNLYFHRTYLQRRTPFPIKLVVDHKDSNPLNARIGNLRSVIQEKNLSFKDDTEVLSEASFLSLVEKQPICSPLPKKPKIAKDGSFQLKSHIFDQNVLPLLNRKVQIIIGKKYVSVHVKDTAGKTRHKVLHRLSFFLKHGSIEPGMIIDHQDHDSKNNRLKNLKSMTLVENSGRSNSHFANIRMQKKLQTLSSFTKSIRKKRLRETTNTDSETIEIRTNLKFNTSRS